MKLQTQYSRATIISSIVVLLIAGIGYYFLLHYVLTQQLDETLHVEEVEIIDYIQKNQSLPEATTFQDQRTSFRKVSNPIVRHFTTLMLVDSTDGDNELSRQLTFPIAIKGDYYAASVSKSQEETEDLIVLVLLVTLALLLLLGILLFFFNRFILKRLWRPFHDTLSSIKHFDLNAPSPVKVPKTSIDEFNELNESVNMMTEKVMKDYLSLKNFTDHASHEIQTPLAVINSRLDLLIQDPGLSAESLHQVQSVYNAVDKISRICQSLLLLTKIENNQFNDKEQVDIKRVIQDKLTELDEWIHGNSLNIQTDLRLSHVSMNAQLADILISNLVINAIKYTTQNKTITIHANSNRLTISNPGLQKLNDNLIYDRFWKSDKSDGTGLGLAIVKQICDKYGFELKYEYKKEFHQFSVQFN
ncbi:MAG: HAMP domain-containing sensor histidine kinase [Chitinophagaceae bacterium]